MFSGGHTYYIQRLFEVQGVTPYAVHCTFQYGANVGKRNRMREAMIFEDEREYYTGERYIAVDVRKVPNMGVKEFQALNYTDKKRYNVKGLEMQLQSIYPALGLSLFLDRTLIVSFREGIRESGRGLGGGQGDEQGEAPSVSL